MVLDNSRPIPRPRSHRSIHRVHFVLRLSLGALSTPPKKKKCPKPYDEKPKYRGTNTNTNTLTQCQAVVLLLVEYLILVCQSENILIFLLEQGLNRVYRQRRTDKNTRLISYDIVGAAG